MRKTCKVHNLPMNSKVNSWASSFRFHSHSLLWWTLLVILAHYFLVDVEMNSVCMRSHRCSSLTHYGRCWARVTSLRKVIEALVWRVLGSKLTDAKELWIRLLHSPVLDRFAVPTKCLCFSFFVWSLVGIVE